MEAIEKCTLIPAKIVESGAPQLRKKGRIQVGCDADITVFNLDTIRDNATFVNPRQTSTGHDYVLVNGTPIIEQGERVEGVLPGQAVRNI